MSDFQALKLQVVEILALSKDAIHIHIGLVVFIGVLAVRPDRRTWAWLAAATVAIALELLDLRDDIASFGRPRWLASAHDLLNTMLWPTILALIHPRITAATRGTGFGRRG